MKRLWVLLLLAAVVWVAEPVEAQGLKAEGFYIGGSVGAGLTKLEFDQINLLDDSALVWKVGAGYRWRFFAIEFDYRQLSQLNAILPGSEITADSKGFTGSLLLILPAGPIDLYARGGGHRATTKVGLGDDITETEEWALMYGGGIAFRIGSFSLRAEYERPQLDAISDLHQVTAGFTVAF
ncbi:MAG: outer membrane beta-barrel protein [Acidobacteria bacterium]|nr:outer membrane beta-barrel protein [Acidobacteriota bacterium]